MATPPDDTRRSCRACRGQRQRWVALANGTGFVFLYCPDCRGVGSHPPVGTAPRPWRKSRRNDTRSEDPPTPSATWLILELCAGSAFLILAIGTALRTTDWRMVEPSSNGIVGIFQLLGPCGVIALLLVVGVAFLGHALHRKLDARSYRRPRPVR